MRDNLDRAIHDGRLDRWHDSWVNKSGVMDTEAMMWLIECIGHRKEQKSSGEYELSSILVDAHNAHKTDAAKALCDRFNMLLFIVAGGLTPKANLADVYYIKATKKSYYDELLRIREQTFRERRNAVTNAQGVVTATVKPPSKIGTIACMNAAINASRANDFTKVKEKFVETRMLTKTQGEQLGWTPEEAFKDYKPGYLQRRS